MSSDYTLVPDGFKRCGTCGQVKPATSEYFSKNKTSIDNLFRDCKICAAERSRRWRAQNQEKVIEYQKYYRQAFPEKLRANKRRYYTDHKERAAETHRLWQSFHRDQAREITDRWEKKHPENRRMRDRQRRARKAHLPYNFTSSDESRALDFWHGCCAACGEPLRDLFGEIEPHFDHWIPLSDSRPDNPGTVPTNMIPLCSPCNRTKHNSDPIKWLQSKFGPRKAKQIQQRVEAYFRWVREQDGHIE